MLGVFGALYISGWVRGSRGLLGSCEAWVG